MKKISSLIFTLISINTFCQIDFIKYYDGEKVEIRTYDQENGKTYINDEIINLKDVEFISIDDNYKANVYDVDYEKIKDIDNFNSQYLFADRIIEGKVNLFEYKLLLGSNKYKTERLFFNLGEEGEVKIANFKNLKPTLSSNEESFKYLKRARNAKRTKKILAWVGISTTIVGLGLIGIEAATGSHNYVYGGIVGGVGFTMFFSTFFIQSTKKQNLNIKKAIELY